MRPYATCRWTDEHVAHMEMNDECPWCGTGRPQAQDTPTPDCASCDLPMRALDTLGAPSNLDPTICVSCADVRLQYEADDEQRMYRAATRRRAPSGHKVLIRGIRGHWLVGCVGCGVIDSARTMRDARAIQRDHWAVNA